MPNEQAEPNLELEEAPEVEEVAEGAEEAAEEQDATAAENSGDGGEGEAEPIERSAASDEAEPNGEKPVPVKAYLAYKKKVAERLQASESRAKEFEAKLAKAASAGDIDPGEYRSMKALVAKFQAAGKKFPELEAAFYAIQEGLDPDLRSMHQALDARVKTLSTLDPATQHRLHQMEQTQRELQKQATELRFERRKATEDSEISKLVKGDPDLSAKLLEAANELARNAVAQMSEEDFARNVPDRVAIAKKLLAWSRADKEALLKSQKAGAPVKAGAAVPKVGGGKPATVDGDKMPADYLSDPTSEKATAWLKRQMAKNK